MIPGRENVAPGNNDDINLPAELRTMFAKNRTQHAPGTVSVNRTVAHFFAGHHAEPERGTFAATKPEHHRPPDKTPPLRKSLPEVGGFYQSLIFGKRVSRHRVFLRLSDYASATVRRLRPFWRRRFRMARPSAVSIRLRKPCLRARLIFDGCHVRFIIQISTKIPKERNTVPIHSKVSNF